MEYEIRGVQGSGLSSGEMAEAYFGRLGKSFVAMEHMTKANFLDTLSFISKRENQIAIKNTDYLIVRQSERALAEFKKHVHTANAIIAEFSANSWSIPTVATVGDWMRELCLSPVPENRMSLRLASRTMRGDRGAARVGEYPSSSYGCQGNGKLSCCLRGGKGRQKYSCIAPQVGYLGAR